MAYVKLDIPYTIPASVSIVIREGVEPLLQDVHWMLATVISDPTDTAPRRQLQVPTAHVLLATVAGVSTQLLHAPGKGTGERSRNASLGSSHGISIPQRVYPITKPLRFSMRSFGIRWFIT